MAPELMVYLTADHVVFPLVVADTVPSSVPSANVYQYGPFND